MKTVLLISITMVLASFNIIAQEEAIVERSFLIIKATTYYHEAQKVAQSASEKLNLDYEPKTDCWPSEQHGFDCEWECDCGETHNGYMPRGQTGGNWISVEHSNAYEEFTNEYFLVVVASGNKENVTAELPRIQKNFPNAYIKEANVYIGCMH